jgi:hypothetical protein
MFMVRSLEGDLGDRLISETLATAVLYSTDSECKRFRDPRLLCCRPAPNVASYAPSSSVQHSPLPPQFMILHTCFYTESIFCRFIQ